MTAFRIAVDVGGPLAGAPGGVRFDAASLPNLQHAVQAIAEAAQRQWAAFAMGAPLPSGKRIEPRSGAYARSIMLRQVGDFAAEIYSDLPYAAELEEGAPARDLKRMLGTSPKVRLSKDGRRYLVIPFRWNTPGTVQGGNVMPSAVHSWWRGKTPSAVTGQHQRVSGLNAGDPRTRGPLTAPARSYSWGSRLGAGDLAALGVTGPAARAMAGMVNFRAPGKSGGAAHSQYLTFRTMTSDSSGWIAPARPGLFPAKTTADQLRPAAEQAFAEAVRRDLARALGGG